MLSSINVYMILPGGSPHYQEKLLKFILCGFLALISLSYFIQARIVHSRDDFSLSYFFKCPLPISAQSKTVLGIYRSDYLLDYRRGACPEDATLSIKQVEMNTISTASVGLSQEKIQNFHK